ncbi:MAG: LEPR-XLL domain-containing protein [Phycisphaeraceae bacterium]|nr:LEPR-XLL domain-containing protein [Phycisphaeraceae bacterium]
MSRWDIRSVFSRTRPHRRIVRHDGSATGGLARRAGARQGGEGLEALEPRVLLSGDHPSLVDFPSATEIAIDAAGIGFDSGMIESVGTDDLFKFTAPATDFVRIRADGFNPANRSGDTTPLDTKLGIYDSTGALIATSSGDGVLTGGTPKDAWYGFLAIAGQTYYVDVLSDSATTATGTGDYVIRIKAASTLLKVDDVTGEALADEEDIPDAPALLPPIMGEIGTDDPASPGDEFAGDDIVYKVTTLSGSFFQSMAGIAADADAEDLDSRLDVYDATGAILKTNSQAGFLTSAYTIFQSAPDATYYIRVRSDEFKDPGTVPSSGEFVLRADFAAEIVELDPVSRIGLAPLPLRRNPTDTGPVIRSANDFDLFRFQSKGFGQAFITTKDTGAPHDLALTVFDDAGNQLAFIDDFIGNDAESRLPFNGGQEIFFSVTGFDDRPGGTYIFVIEADHTQTSSDDIFTDDHVDDLDTQAQDATALIAGTPTPLFDGYGNVVRDHGIVQQYLARGRIYNQGDVDLFQFIPPVDMLGDYAGNNDDAGSALYVGGLFSGAEQTTEPFPVDSRALTLWDAGDFWPVYYQMSPVIPYGFANNADTPETAGPAVYSMQEITVNGQPALAVGGDFDLVVPGPFGPQTFKNLALWLYNPSTGLYDWASIGDTDGPVRAMITFDPEAFDPDGDGTGMQIEDPGGPWLMVGGEFTTVNGGNTDATGLAYFDYTDGTGWTGLTDLDGAVYAFATYDPADPGQGRDANPGEGLLEVPDPPDAPTSVFIGGEFTAAATTFYGGTITATNIATFNGAFVAPAGFGSSEVAGGNPVLPPSSANGPVYAITVYDPPPIQGPGGEVDLPPVVVFGGDFTEIGGEWDDGIDDYVPFAANNLAYMGLVDATQDGQVPGYTPSLLWNAVGTGTDGPVYALNIWTPAENTPLPAVQHLLIGGEFADFDGAVSGNIAAWRFDTSLALGVGFNGPVRTIQVFVDAQEQLVENLEEDYDIETSRQVVYAGGSFDEIATLPAPTPVGHIAAFDVHDTPFGPQFFWTPMAEGVDGDVYSLAVFDDQNPAVDNSGSQWDRHDRASGRAQIVLSPLTDAFANMYVRIYDSNFTLLYENDTIAPPFPDPAGALDPSRAPGTTAAFIAPEMWAGETYYIEVSDVNGTGTGRYQLSVIVEAEPTGFPPGFTPNEDADGISYDVDEIFFEPADPDDDIQKFASARPFMVDNFGDFVNVNATATNPYPSDHGKTSSYSGRFPAYKTSPSLGGPISDLSDFERIDSIQDTDVWAFTAPTTGTVEVRISTLGLPFEFAQLRPDAVVTKTKTFDSSLDAAIRIFNNDLEQIGYNDDNPVTPGPFINHGIGAVGAVDFKPKDPRLVVPVVAGERYFIMIESGQRYLDGSPANEEDRIEANIRQIDPRLAYGAYRLFVNAPADQNTLDARGHTGDDHLDTINGFGTVVPVRDDGRSSMGLFVNNHGTPDDPIDDFLYDGTIGVAGDVDVFTYIAHQEGTVTVTVDRAQLSPNLIPRIFVQDVNGDVLVDVSATSQTPAVATFPVLHGEYFNIVVASVGGTTGQYTFSLEGPALEDDYADFGEWGLSQPIQLFDFLGRGEIDGSIETPGDSDLFTFQAFDFQQMTVRVNSQGFLNPRVTVYEVTEDLVGNPIFVRIGANDDANGGTDSEVTVSVSTNRTSLLTEETYNDYYILVEGSDPGFDKGEYILSLDFDTTDDHADRPEFEDQNTRELATRIVIDSSTGQGSEPGVIERTSDSDVFRFIAPAGGEAGLNVTRQIGSILDATITVYDRDLNVLATTSGNLPAAVFFNVTRGLEYYVIVEPRGASPEDEQVGGYTVSIDGPAVDDHPNETEFNLATVIPLNAASGDGQVGTGVLGGNNPTISPGKDTDLFRFTTIAKGQVAIAAIPLGNFATLRPKVTVFDSTFTEIASASTTNEATTVTVTLSGTLKNQVYYVLVEDTFGAAPALAEYTLVVNGPAGVTPPPDDPSEIDFNNPTTIVLNNSGDAQANDAVNVANDRDLFSFVAPADGEVFVQVVTPGGSLLDATLTILDQPNENPDSVVAFDAGGIPGATANLSFDGVGGTMYYAIVDGVGLSTGSYTLRVDAVGPRIVTGIDEVDAFEYNHRIYYPEGFANNKIREYVSIANPNDYDVRYSLILRYETGSRDAVIQKNVLVPAGSRGGITLSNAGLGRADGVRKGAPYAIEIVSTGPLGATLSHYDFDISTGEPFTQDSSATWTLARVERRPGLVNDFIVYFNPNPFDVTVNIIAHSAGGATTITQTVGALRRGGLNINNTVTLPVGTFGVTVTSSAKNASDSGQFVGIVTALSHFDVASTYGFGVLGSSTGGATRGAITSLTRSSSVTPEIVLYNGGATAATVDLTGKYIRANLPDLLKRVQVPARSTVVLTGASLGLINDQPVGIEYVADRVISVTSSEVQKGDADGMRGISRVGTEWFFGDAYIGRKRAGELYFETLNFYNPAATSADVAVTLLYTNGSSTTVNISVQSRDFAELQLHELDAFLNGANSTNAFAINVSSITPIAATLTHYDLFLGGGWGMSGAPLGLLNPISDIITV